MLVFNLSDNTFPVNNIVSTGLTYVEEGLVITKETRGAEKSEGMEVGLDEGSVVGWLLGSTEGSLLGSLLGSALGSPLG